MAQHSQQQASNLQRVQAFLQAIDLYPINGEVGDRKRPEAPADKKTTSDI